MTGDNTDGKRKDSVSAWLFGAIFHSGWRRRVFFAVVVLLFIVLVRFLRGGVDYQNDPAALVPRGAAAFVETRELGSLLKNAAMLPLWVEERRAGGDEQWNHIQALIAGMLGESVHGFGSRLPQSWVEGARRAALALSAGDGPDSRFWTLFLELPSPQAALRELRMEPGVTVAKFDEGNENLVVISGNDESRLLAGAVGPWLAVSPVIEGVVFAVDAVRRPVLTLAATGILPAWPRAAALRGFFDPAVILSASTSQHLSRLAGWIRPDSRFAFTVSLNSSGEERIDLRHVLLGEARGGGLFWSLVKFIFGLAAVACVALALAIVLAMLGWGGWLKLAAAKAGIKPAEKPLPIEPSTAFREDAGLKASPGEPVGDGSDPAGLEAGSPEVSSGIRDVGLAGAASEPLPEEVPKPAKKVTRPRTAGLRPEAGKSTSAAKPGRKPSAGGAEETPARAKRRAPKQ